ncbi:MAG: hypothetical protein JWO82_676, partial [Akkermansiaceae bacterium]|nr:hypothetical protein [Akkermansiaceae bacterium]
QPGSLEQLLVERKAGIQWQSEAGKAGPVLATIWRSAADGKRTPLQADLRGDAALPALEWGDVVELSYEPEEQRIFGYGSTAVQNSTLPENLVWKLRQRISFPVVVEMDGQTQDFTVRGGLVTFDPTRPEVPLMGAAQLARLISQQKPEKYAQKSLTVIRQGWPDVRVLSTTEPSADFALQKGDRLKWETQDTSPGPKWAMRASEIRVCSPGLPFAVRFQEFLGGGGGDGTPRDNLAPSNSLRPTQPSLLQAIAMLYGSAANRLKEAPANDPVALAAWLPGALEGEILSVLPHPDLTHIRVRRKSEDGAEKIIEIDLQKAMDGIKDGTTAEEARQADLLLQPGDVVELPVDRKALGQPWTGFTAPQRALLEKALSGSVQITYEAGQVTLLPVLYRTPRLTATPGGLVPLPASEGTSSLVLRDVLPDGLYDAVSKDGLLTDMKSDRILLSERFQFLCRSLNPTRPAPRIIPPPPSPARRPQVAPAPRGR